MWGKPTARTTARRCQFWLFCWIVQSNGNTKSQSKYGTKAEPEEIKANSTHILTSKPERDVEVVDINRANKIVNHPNEVVIRAMAESRGQAESRKPMLV